MIGLKQEVQVDVLPKTPVSILKGIPVPSVLDCENWQASGEVVDITNFKNGKHGQHLWILGDGTSTVKPTPKILTVDNGDRLLELDHLYHFKNYNNIWYEQGLTGAAGVAGPPGPQGEQGDQGIQGIQGVQGPQGIQGPIGPIGPQGIQGETGEQGEVGPEGPAGVSSYATLVALGAV